MHSHRPFRLRGRSEPVYGAIEGGVMGWSPASHRAASHCLVVRNQFWPSGICNGAGVPFGHLPSAKKLR